MIEVRKNDELRAYRSHLRATHRTIAFVPTMGNLHAGHRRLMEDARRHADAVIASIYVNPLQFAAGEDFETYPRTPDDDREALLAAGVDLLYMPGEQDIYPRGIEHQTRVEVPGLSDILCGAHRPGHFRGVTTVVNRLLHLIAPDVAVFGKKDYQQLMLVRLMVADLSMPVEVIGVDTVREPDGLAMSSRNNYLTPNERHSAPALYQALGRLRDRVRAGEDVARAESAAAKELQSAGFRPDYISVRRAADLAPPQPGDRGLIALAAAWLGRTRLIDNVEFERQA